MPDIVTLKKGKRRPGRPTHPLKRSDLVAVSQVAFAERGYSGTTLATIADLVGIQKASLYHHVSSKQELYFDVMRGLVSDLRQLVAEARLEEGDFVARIDRLGAVVIDYLATHREAGRLLVRELVGDGPYVKSGGGRDVETTLTVVSSFLQAGMDEGAFRRQDPRHLALSIVGVHLFYFAASEMTSAFMGADIYCEEMVGERKEELLRHVRSLVLPE